MYRQEHITAWLPGVSAKLHPNRAGAKNPIRRESPFINHGVMNETPNRWDRYVTYNYEN